MKTNATRTTTSVDVMDPARAGALQAALGDPPSIKAGDALPPFFHRIYFWDCPPRGTLGRDGHASTEGLFAEAGLTKRMWAAGRLSFHGPLLAGVRAEKTTVVEAVTRKTGRSGPLAFVTLRHDIKQRQALVLTEYQELVYRENAPANDVEPPVPPVDPEDTFEVTFDSTLLFRYSALTFNGHRIHYDEPYARDVEGYDGLVVHGPLLAHLLMQLAAIKLGRLTQFSYRATAPLMHHEAALLCWNDGTAWVAGPDGRQCMIAKAE